MTETYTQADLDAAVAAALEKAAEGFDSIAGMIAKYTWDTPEGDPIKLFLDDGPHSGPAVEWISKTLILLRRLNIQYADEIRTLIPKGALAERDVKVRADALREVKDIIYQAAGDETQMILDIEALIPIERQRLQAELETWKATQHYSYIGKDGKPRLARDMEDELDTTKDKLAKAIGALGDITDE